MNSICFFEGWRFVLLSVYKAIVVFVFGVDSCRRKIFILIPLIRVLFVNFGHDAFLANVIEILIR
mgnify:CR=1 FL=1